MLQISNLQEQTEDIKECLIKIRNDTRKIIEKLEQVKNYYSYNTKLLIAVDNALCKWVENINNKSELK